MNRGLKVIIGLVGLLALVLIIFLLTRGSEVKKTSLSSQVPPSIELNRVQFVGFKSSGNKAGFYFNVSGDVISRTLAGEVIPYEEAKKCVRLSPEVKGHIEWIDEENFVYFLDSPLELPANIKFEISCIPVSSKDRVSIEKRQFDWNFKVLNNFWVEYSTSNKAHVNLRFTLPVKDTLSAEKLITLVPITGKAEPVKRYWKSERLFVMDINLTDISEFKADVVIARGLEFKGNVKTREKITRTIEIKPAHGYMWVRSVKFTKKEEGGYVVCIFESQSRSVLHLKENIKEYIQIKPEIDFKVTLFNNRVFVNADFEPGKEYTLMIKRGVASREGFVLKEDYVKTFQVPIPRAKLRFLVKGLFIGKEKEIKIPFAIRRIKNLRMTVAWMPPEHIPFYYFAGGGSSGNFYKFGRNIAKDIKLPFANKGYHEKVEYLNLSNLVNLKEPGLYKITIRGDVTGSRYPYTESSNVVVSVSDIALVAKYYNEKLYVWAFDVNNLTPISNAEFTVYSSSGFVIGKLRSNASGMAILKEKSEDLVPYLVTVKSGSRWSFIVLPETRIDMGKYDVGGRYELKPYSGFIYSQRDLYRPGDTVDFNVIVRKSGSFSGVNVPVLVKLKDPRGKLVRKYTGNTDESGYFGGKYISNPTSPTGRYSFELYIGGKFYASEFVNIETFVPERMTVSIDVEKKIVGDSIVGKLSAMYLFGTPCAGMTYTLRFSGKSERYRSRSFADYVFGVPDRMQNMRYLDVVSGTLDNRGEAKINFDLKKYIKRKSNPLKVRIIASVREEGSGRSTEKSKDVVVYTSPYYVGLKSNKKAYSEGDDVEVSGVVVSPCDTLYKDVKYVRITLYRLYWIYSYYYDYGYDNGSDDLRWDRWQKMMPVMSIDSVPVKDGKFSITFKYPGGWDDYVVEAEAPSGIKARKLLVNESWWWYAMWRNERPQSPEFLDVVLSKDTADENETITARVKLPFEGKILWAVELDSVYTSKWQDAKGKTAEWKFKVPGGIPNVYVTCLLVRNQGDYLLRRAFGVGKLRIRPSRLKLNITLDAPDKVKTGGYVDIVLKGNEEFEATLSVVDEGILQITNFRTPSPIEGILKDIRLLFGTSETFGWFSPKYLATGGGYRSKESSALKPRFFTTVTYFSGLKKSRNKIIKLRVPVGSYQGKVRIMVQAFNKKRMAKLEKDVIVSDDVIVFVTMPRFLCANDTFFLPVTLMNTKDENMDVSLKIKSSQIQVGNYPDHVVLEPKGKKTINIRSFITNALDSAVLSVNVDFGTGKFKDRFVIPVYPDRPYITETKTYKIAGKGNINIDHMLSGYYKQGHYVDIYLTRSPVIRGLYVGRELLGYPYGCVEQTSSKLYVLVALSPYINLFGKDYSKEDIDEYINYGIARLMSMQLWTGAFGFWPGSHEVYKGFSGYATLVLSMARERGYYVPEQVLNSAYSYLKDNEMDIGLSLYALAHGGKLNSIPGGVESAIRLFKKSKYMPDKLWSILALYESGKVELARKYFKKVMNTRVKTRAFWIPYCYVYYDPLFDNALKFYVAQKLDIKRSIIDSLGFVVDSLLRMDPPYMRSTQEIIWSLLGLSEYIGKLQLNLPEATITDGKRTYRGKKIKAMLYFKLNNPPSGGVSINVSDTGYYLIVQNTGFKKQGKFKEDYNGLLVSRRLFTYDGRPFSGDSIKIKPGDLLIMQVSWRSQKGWMKNVAIEVPIPAGMEIENPRLNKESLPSWTRRYRWRIANPDYVDIRDDRVIIFNDTYYDSRMYFILLRANLKGSYFMSPVRGVVMYRPEIYYHGLAERIHIQ